MIVSVIISKNMRPLASSESFTDRTTTLIIDSYIALEVLLRKHVKAIVFAFHSRWGPPMHLKGHLQICEERDFLLMNLSTQPNTQTPELHCLTPIPHLYTHVLECEQQVLNDVSRAALQADETTFGSFGGFDALSHHIKKAVFACLGKLAKSLDLSVHDYISEMIENISFLVGGLMAARDFNDVFRTIIAVTRFITKKSFGKSVTELFARFAAEPDVQGGCFNDIRHLLDNYDAVKNSPVVEKVRRLSALALASVFLSSSGITSRMEDLMNTYAEAVKQLLNEVDFIAGLVDLVTFMVERLAQCWHQKSLKPFFHSSKTYGKWATDAYEIIEQSQLMHNPEAHGLTYHGFLESLDKCIEHGVEIQKFSKAADKRDVVLNILSKLRITRGEFLTRKAAGEERRAPFCLLVNGGSGVGKSSFTRTFFAHFGKMFRLPEGSEFLYTRCFTDEYWSGFRSQMWGILLDDIAFVNPNKGTEDRSLSELLQVANNVAYCPPQAALEDKGKTPLRAECVIGTTNTEHLNAQFWFANPVAVRRRFPYVVTLRPKPEYARDDAPDMLDPNKVPIPDAGCYPDLWIITLSKVTVHNVGDRGQQNTETTQMNVFSSIYNFFAIMSELIREFRQVQAQAAANDDNMKSVKLCPMCDLPVRHCVCAMLQAGEVSVDQIPLETFQYNNVPPVLENIYSGFAATCAGGAAWTLFSNIDDISEKISRKVKTYTRDFAVRYLRSLGGSLAQSVYKNKYLRMVLMALGAFGVGYATYRTYKNLFAPTLTKEEKQADELPIMRFGVTPPSAGDEKENFYHQKDDYRADLVVSEQTKSWRSLEWTAICKKFTNSVVAIRATRKCGDELRVREGKAVCLGGRLYVTDNHIIPDTECVLEVIRERHVNGLTTNVRRVMDPATVLRMPEKELVFFQLLDSFDCKDITPFLSTADFRTVGPGALIAREANGEAVVHQLKHMKRAGLTLVPQLTGQPSIDLWSYTVPVDTYVGLCGAMLVVRSPTGPVVVGLHLLGKGKDGHCLSLTKEDVDLAKKHFFPVYSPGAPMLESRERKVEVGPLHEKSVFRFIGEGTGRVFGKLSLPHVQPKSTVCATVFRDEAVRHGFKVETGAPVMKGKKLWRQAVLPVVEQEFLFKESVIEKCAMAYADECYAGLSEEDKAEIRAPLSFMAAVNGVPGRKYIDSINRGTSAGFPWMRTKKSLTVPLPADDTWQDPITFNDEVLERINEMMERYLRGELVAPVFTAHAKDEPLPFAKIAIEKTRVMNGAPLDWSILVRMVYLPMVRVIQNNKFLFEAMPGAVAQSIEWDHIYKYLTHFGTDRMVAGDYGKFDKKMSAVLILWAFFAMIRIAKKCGVDDRQLALMWGIAYDVACSFCNFNGDFVQFLGSNPSGHPLTVILNCIVNCLYMRYCYHELNPEKEVASFRKFVRLVTYGDDNEFGTSREWFNHTAISELLATLGVEYTMADKGAESVPFLDITQTSFLKRGWRYEPELDAVVCPITHATIDKMMTTWVPSTQISAFAQGEEIIRNVGVEYFWYGREVFEAKQVVLKEIFTKTIPPEYETPATFQTWDQLVLKWKMASGISVAPVDSVESTDAE